MGYIALLLIKLLRIVSWLIPFSLFSAICRASSIRLGKVKPSVKEVALAQIGYALSHSSALSKCSSLIQSQTAAKHIDSNSQAKVVFDGSLSHLGECMAELVYFNRLLKSEPDRTTKTPKFKHIDFESNVDFLNLYQDKIPHIVLSGHLGNFELLAAFHRAQSVPVSVIGRKPKLKFFDELLRALRNESKLNAIWRSDPSAKREIINAIKNGEGLAALIDHDTNIDNGFSKFFGLDAASPIALIRLAIKYKVVVATSFIVRKSSFSHLVISEMVDYNPDDPGAEQFILDTYNQRLMTLIEQYPFQWFWWHRRWRRRPNMDYKKEPDKLMSTKEYITWIKSLT